MAKEKDDNSVTIQRVIFVSVPSSIIVIWLVKWTTPSWIPFETFQPWRSNGHFSEWLYRALPMFVWGVGASFIHRFFISDAKPLTPSYHLIAGFLRSIFAGVVEEISFRWLIFFRNMAFIIVSNFFFFHGLGMFFGQDWSWVKWFYGNILIPIANFTTLDGLASYLYSPLGWQVGAAIITTNAFFRDGHKYRGTFGYLNSWFCGMFLFWIMFQYGLIAAIFVHFLYDMLIHLVLFMYALIHWRY